MTSPTEASSATAETSVSGSSSPVLAGRNGVARMYQASTRLGTDGRCHHCLSSSSPPKPVSQRIRWFSKPWTSSGGLLPGGQPRVVERGDLGLVLRGQQHAQGAVLGEADRPSAGPLEQIPADGHFMYVRGCGGRTAPENESARLPRRGSAQIGVSTRRAPEGI